MSEKRFRQFAPFVLLSVLVHMIGLGVFEYLQLWSTGQEAVRVRFTAPRHYTFTLGNGTEGVGLGGPAVPRFQNVPEAQSTSDPESGGNRFPVFDRDTEPGGKEEWQDTGDRVGSGKVDRPSVDSVAKAFEFGHHGAEGRNEDSELSDLLAFDVERRVRTTAVIDRRTGKLKKAYLYLPCYRNHPFVWEGGKELGLIMAAIENGHRTPDRPPIVPVVDYMFLGMFDPRGGGLHDRVHTFSRFPRRRLLNDSELGRYAVILTSYIDLESTETMVRYLLGGGYVICEDVRVLYSAVRDSRAWKPEKLWLVSVEKGDRLFHSYYDINEYEFHGTPCAPIAPVPAIEYDGRVVAVSPPKFNYNTSCESNKLFVNALAFGLVQSE